MPLFYLYILKCSDKTYYVGHTDNLDCRMLEHKTGIGGAKYTVNRRPVELVYIKPFISRIDAVKHESKIKKWSKKKKEALINNNWESVKKLSKKIF